MHDDAELLKLSDMTVIDRPAALELTPDEAKALCIRSMRLMAHGTRPEFDEVVHPDAVNREAKDEPLEARRPGPAGFWATALWLRRAFEDLDFEIHEVIAEGDLVVVHNTMSGRHTGVFTLHGGDGGVIRAMPPTGKRFAGTQTHLMRVRDGLVIEHWANRDDQGMAMQLGWIPPSPAFLLRSFLATRRARRG